MLFKILLQPIGLEVTFEMKKKNYLTLPLYTRGSYWCFYGMKMLGYKFWERFFKHMNCHQANLINRPSQS